MKIEEFREVVRCSKCGADVVLKCRHPQSAVSLLLHWNYIGQLCAKCIKEGARK